MSLSRDNIIAQIGGQNQYNFLIESFCERIQREVGLKDLFMSFDLESLAERMTALLDIILEQSADESLDESARNKVVMNNFSLFEAGMNAGHLKQLQANFECGLHDVWAEEHLIEQCNKKFAKFEAVFEEEGADMEQSILVGRVVEVRMMVARSA